MSPHAPPGHSAEARPGESATPEDFRRPRRTAAAFAAVVAVVATGVGLLDKHSELPVYLRAAGRFVAGEQFYRPDEPPAFTYPPFAVLPYRPLLSLPESARGPAYAVVNGLLCGVTAWLIAGLALPVTSGLTVRTRRVCAVAIALLAGRFVLSPLEYQSNDLFVVAFSVVGVAALSRGRSAGGGASLGLAAAFKATPLLFLPVLVWRRQLLAAAAFGVAMIAATGLPDLWSPADDGRPWAVTWYDAFVSKVEVGNAPEAAGAWTRWNGLNQSLGGTIYRLGTPVEPNGIDVFDVAVVSLTPRTVKLVTLAAAACVLLAVAFATFPRDERDLSPSERRFRRLAEAGVVFAAMLLLSPMSSKQHFCVLAVPITVAVVDVATRRRDPWVIAGLAVIGVCGSLGGKDLVGREFGNFLQACGTITFATLVALATSAHVVSARQREQIGAIGRPEIDRADADPAGTGENLRTAA
ncbi:MAG: glycosyltransferase family 87 protein [Planctomycetota bacterium]